MSASNSNEALLEQFCAITGADQDVGRRLLEACNNNLEMAIGMHMDGGCGEQAATSSTAQTAGPTQAAQTQDEDEVRAPIPQRTEQLVDDSFSLEGLAAMAKPPLPLGFRRRARKSKSVFDGFRDFQAEIRQQDLAVAGTSAGPSSSSAAKKRKTLEDLFRPPLDIMFKGPFHEAREIGTASNKWLIVNIQNAQEFVCQALNRDTWSNPGVKAVLKKNFIFWQVYHDSEEGKKYMQFYKVHEWPYVAVVDPVTGENLTVWNKFDAKTFSELANEFLSERPSPDGSTQDPSSTASKSESILDASEDHQLEAAIQASLKDASQPPVKRQKTVTLSDSADSEADSELETFSDSDEETENKLSKPLNQVQKSGDSIKGSTDLPSSQANRAATEGATNNVDPDSGTIMSCSDSSNDVGESTSSSCISNVHDSVPSSSSNDTQEMAAQDTTVPKETVIENWKDYLGQDDDTNSELMLRLPDGTRKSWTVPCSSKLKALELFVVTEGYPKENYELVTNFPKRKLSTMDSNATLKEIGLYPRETVFVQER